MSSAYRVQFQFKCAGPPLSVPDKKVADSLRDILEGHGVVVEDGNDMCEYWSWWGGVNLCGGQSPQEKHNEIRDAIGKGVLMASDWWWDERSPDESFEDEGFCEDLRDPEIVEGLPSVLLSRIRETTCARCCSFLSGLGRCGDVTCPFSDHEQSCPAGWAGHPEHTSGPCECLKSAQKGEES